MKKIIIALLLIFNIGITINAFSQVLDNPPRDGVYDKIHSGNRRPVPATNVREADVTWQSRVWRVINFKEKMNQAFYYPESHLRDRISFMEMLINGLKEGVITSYDDEEFLKPLTYEEMNSRFVRIDTLSIDNPDTGIPEDKVVKTEMKLDQVYTLRVKEDWFFDRQRSVMDVRILGICPVMQLLDKEGNFKAWSPMFWIYFPDARSIFAKTELFNTHNDTERRTYDDIFWKRAFASYIIKQSNVYDRKIDTYKTGLDALLEAEKIKDGIFSMEHDLWEL